jgi:hypothetical protein
MDINEHSQDTYALLKIIEMSEKDKAQGRFSPLEQADDDMRTAIFGNLASASPAD